MAKLDSFLDVISADDQFILELNREPTIKRGDTQKPVMNQTLSAAQIRGLVTEITPENKKDQLGRDSETVFKYSLNDKTFDVAYTIQAGGLIKVIIEQEQPAQETEVAPQASREAVTQGAGAQTQETQSAVTGSVTLARVEGEPELNALFRTMIERGASDLHLSSLNRPILRIGGELEEIAQHPVINPEQMMELIFEIMPEKNIAEFKEKKDSDFPYEIEGLARFRCNAFMDKNGIGGVFRQIPLEILSSDQLGLSKAMLELCYLKKGLVVVTGPTGSGKSTTLAAMIDYINRTRGLHIITIEDPVEFVHKNKKCLINQREVGLHTQSFSNALRAALREDPDILLVGEMRDLETISIAIETAETGHLVFGTLHTTTAASTVDRIIDQFPPDRQEQIRTMLSTSLKGVIAQTLCKKIGGGRVAAHEVLLINSAISNLIREGKVFQIPSIIQTSKGLGMELLNNSLMKLVEDKVIEPQEAYINSSDTGSLNAMFKAKGIEVKLGNIEND